MASPAPTRSVTPVLSLLGHDALVFALLHGEPLHLHALRALVAAVGGEPLVVVRRPDVARVTAEVDRTGLAARVVPDSEWWPARLEAPPTDLLLHDALCPLASAPFLAEIAGRAGEGTSVVAYRPVTDTVKTAVDGTIQGTIDREQLAAVTSPVLACAAALQEEPPLADFGRLVDWLRRHGPVELVQAPTLARRVDDASAVNLLECVDELGRQVRTEPAG